MNHKKPEDFLKRGKGNFINCTDYDDAIEAMEKYAQQFANQSKWISVEEPPEKDGLYLCINPNFRNEQCIGRYSTYTKSWFLEYSADRFHPSYYQPLPSPPTK